MKKILLFLMSCLVIPFLGGCNKTVDSNNKEEPNINEAFDISSLNGKTYYPYYVDEIRIAGITEFPYTYTIPDGVNDNSHYSFETISIRDSKVFYGTINTSKQGSVVTYNFSEKELDFFSINNRYFIYSNNFFEGGEIVFSNDLIIIDDHFLFATKEYAENKNTPIFDIEAQHKKWLYETIINKIDMTFLWDVVGTLSTDNPTVTLPNKTTTIFDEVNYEVLFQYVGIEPSNAYELDGYNLTAKLFQDGHVVINIRITIESYSTIICIDNMIHFGS